MAKSIGKPLLPEWVAYPLFLAVVTTIMLLGFAAGMAVQLLCFILQPSTIGPTLREAREIVIDIFHDLRN